MNAFSIIIIIIIINKILIIVILIVMCVPRYIVGVNYIFNKKNGGVLRPRRGTACHRAVSGRNWRFGRKKRKE
jgi:hypothetical protein